MKLVDHAAWSGRRGRTCLDAAPELREVRGAHDVPLDPGREAVTVPADSVPCGVEGVVPFRVTEGKAGVRTAGDLADGVDDPRRQHHRVGPRLELVHDFFDGDNGSPGGEY